MKFLRRIGLLALVYAVAAAGIWTGFRYWVDGDFPSMARLAGDAASERTLDPNRTLELQYAPTPRYVVEKETPEPQSAEAGLIQGARVLLTDTQHSARVRPPSQYVRYVIRAERQLGVQAASQYTIPFNPAFQELVIHEAVVIRAGVREDRTNRLRADFIRREGLLEVGVLTGLVQAIVRVEDVRLGDTVDMSYSIVGRGGGTAPYDTRSFVFDQGFPAQVYAIRSVWPGEVDWHVFNGREVEVSEDGGRTVISYEAITDFDAEAAADSQDDAPVFDMFLPPWRRGEGILLSNFGSWETVSAWLAPHYRPEVTEPVREAVADIMTEHDDPERHAMAALRFVQNDIRYFSVSLGEAGYLPASPDETLRSRTGDCKAKVLLLLSMLKAMGIEGEAAIVNASLGFGLEGLPATPQLFDHMIARVRINGETHWVDPTLPFQGGGFARRAPVDYGFALPILAENGALIRMPPHPNETITLEVQEVYRLADDAEAPAVFERTSVFRGEAANAVRAALSNASADTFHTSIKATIENTYGGLEEIEPFSLDDDYEANVITYVTRYALSEPYEETDDGFTLALRTDNVNILPPQFDRDRTDPILITHPSHSRHVIRIVAPEQVDFDLSDRTLTRDNPALAFTAELSVQDNIAEYALTYRSKTREAQDEDILPVYDDLTRASDFSLTKTLLAPAGSDGPDLSPGARLQIQSLNFDETPDETEDSAPLD